MRIAAAVPAAARRCRCPAPDGLYQVGKQLYEEPFWPVQHARTRWVLRDRATWRDLAGGALIPLVSLS